MKCQRGARPIAAACSAFGTSSCARFSPRSTSPAASASSTAATGCVFVTPTIGDAGGVAAGTLAGLGDLATDGFEALGDRGGGGHGRRLRRARARCHSNPLETQMSREGELEVIAMSSAIGRMAPASDGAGWPAGVIAG